MSLINEIHISLTLNELIQGHIPFQNNRRSERVGHETAFLLLDGQLTVFVTTGIVGHVDGPPRTLVTHIPGPCLGHSRLQQQRPASIHSLLLLLHQWTVLFQITLSASIKITAHFLLLTFAPEGFSSARFVKVEGSQMKHASSTKGTFTKKESQLVYLRNKEVNRVSVPNSFEIKFCRHLDWNEKQNFCLPASQIKPKRFSESGLDVCCCFMGSSFAK